MRYLELSTNIGEHRLVRSCEIPEDLRYDPEWLEAEYLTFETYVELKEGTQVGAYKIKATIIIDPAPEPYYEIKDVDPYRL